VPPRDPVAWIVVEEGWEVLGRNGEKLGNVEEVAGDTVNDIFSGLVVRAGLVRGKRFVPAERVSQILEGRIVVDLDPDEFERLSEKQND
jgi:uncharacterized protein YrrD